MVLVLGVGVFTTLYQIIKGKISRLYYLLVIIIVALPPFLVVRNVLPQIRDLGNLKYENYVSTIGICTSFNRGGFLKEVVIGNQFYEFNPWEFAPESLHKYRIHYLPNSQYIVKLEAVE